MLSGIIFVREGIISLDLHKLLSQYYKIVNVFKNFDLEPEHISGIDFIILDSDPYSDQELRSILRKLNLDSNVNIVKITSLPPTLESRTIEAEMHSGPPIKIIQKPFTDYQIICAIEGVQLPFYP